MCRFHQADLKQVVLGKMVECNVLVYHLLEVLPVPTALVEGAPAAAESPVAELEGKLEFIPLATIAAAV